MLGWLSEDGGYQDVFKAGGDLYVDMAKRIFGKEEISKDQRFVGKVAILGLGYGMGWEKFLATAQSYGLGTTSKQAKAIVDIYRESYHKIPAYWRFVDNAVKVAIKTDKKQTVGRVSFFLQDNYLKIELPSARHMSYLNPTVRTADSPIGRRPAAFHMGTNAVTRKWEERKTYGGRSVENICQGVARDLLVDAMMRLENAGYPVVFHVHDEVVCEVDKDYGSPEEMARIMCRVPPWAGGCMIEAEGFESERYRK